MKKFLKNIFVYTTIICFLFFIISSHSEKVSIYKCETMDKSSDIFFYELSVYRFWVKLWNKSDANLVIEAPDGSFIYHKHLKDEGLVYGLYENEDANFDNTPDSLQGMISKISKQIYVSSDSIQLKGHCALVE